MLALLVLLALHVSNQRLIIRIVLATGANEQIFCLFLSLSFGLTFEWWGKPSLFQFAIRVCTLHQLININLEINHLYKQFLFYSHIINCLPLQKGSAKVQDTQSLDKSQPDHPLRQLSSSSSQYCFRIWIISQSLPHISLLRPSTRTTSSPLRCCQTWRANSSSCRSIFAAHSRQQSCVNFFFMLMFLPFDTDLGRRASSGNSWPFSNRSSSLQNSMSSCTSPIRLKSLVFISPSKSSSKQSISSSSAVLSSPSPLKTLAMRRCALSTMANLRRSSWWASMSLRIMLISLLAESLFFSALISASSSVTLASCFSFSWECLMLMWFLRLVIVPYFLSQRHQKRFSFLALPNGGLISSSIAIIIGKSNKEAFICVISLTLCGRWFAKFTNVINVQEQMRIRFSLSFNEFYGVVW